MKLQLQHRTSLQNGEWCVNYPHFLLEGIDRPATHRLDELDKLELTRSDRRTRYDPAKKNLLNAEIDYQPVVGICIRAPDSFPHGPRSSPTRELTEFRVLFKFPWDHLYHP
jgi:hypothetical protein